MKIIVTGTSNGIGKAIAEKFLTLGHEVIGFDILDSTISHTNYKHMIINIYTDKLPELENIDILINNAGVQNSNNDIDINLKGTIRVTEKYGITPHIKSIVFIASASASTGSEFPEYAASKGGIVTYMKNVALRISSYGATANSMSPGGVITKLNDHVMNTPSLWKEIMDVTPLKKWATAEEIAEWVYFVAIINKSMTAQDLLIDNGESTNFKFVW